LGHGGSRRCGGDAEGTADGAAQEAASRFACYAGWSESVHVNFLIVRLDPFAPTMAVMRDDACDGMM
jgi:hypothetical protein